MTIAVILTLFLCCFTLTQQQQQHRQQPDLSDKIRHKEHEIREEDIIELPIGRFPEPKCEYSVHWKKKNGPIVTEAVKVGEPLYHRWRCSRPNFRQDLYCIMVHNCTVSGDGGHSTVPIIDQFGCTLFPSILPHVSYESDLQAGLTANAFLLDIDRPAMSFRCNIRLLVKDNGRCERPECIPVEWYERRPNPHSGRRG